MTFGINHDQTTVQTEASTHKKVKEIEKCFGTLNTKKRKSNEDSEKTMLHHKKMKKRKMKILSTKTMMQ